MSELLRDARAIWVPVACGLLYFFILLPIGSLAQTTAWVFLKISNWTNFCIEKLADFAERNSR